MSDHPLLSLEKPIIAMAHLDNHVSHITLQQDLYFTQIMGHMDLFNIINT